MKFNKSLFVFLTLFFNIFFVAYANVSPLESTLQKYKDSTLVQMQVTKIVKSEVMQKENKFEGKIYFSSGKLRWENSKPEKSLIVFDGDTMWNVQFPSEDFPGPVQVARGKIDKKNQSKIFLTSLFKKQNVMNEFKVLSEKKEKNSTIYKLEAKNKDPMVQDLEIKVENENLYIEEVKYKDDIGNLTLMSFSKVEFKTEIKKGLFKYFPPKNAQVTNL
jgi:outer membrane lipoprotein carrier protein